MVCKVCEMWKKQVERPSFKSREMHLHCRCHVMCFETTTCVIASKFELLIRRLIVDDL